MRSLRVHLAQLSLPALLPPAPREVPEQKRWADRPAWQRIAAALAPTLFLAAVITVLYPLRDRLPFDGPHTGSLRGLVLQGTTGLVVLLVAHLWIGRFAAAGLQWRGAATSCLLSIPMLVLGVAELRVAASPAVSTVLLSLVLGFVTGCFEELYGRGVLVTVLGGARHLLLAVLLSSILFAYLHLPTYVPLFGFGPAVLRCASSSAFSACFALIRLRSGSLFGPILFHAVNNAQMAFQAPRSDSPTHDVSFGPLIVGCIMLVLHWAVCYRGIARSVREAAPA